MATADHRSIHYRKKAIPENLWRPIFDRERDKIYQRFADEFPPHPETSIVNVGANGSFTDPAKYFLESRYPHPENIVACGLEEPDHINECYPDTRYEQIERGKPLPFEDDEFDVLFCNAVIEHVGDRNAQRTFLREILRVARSAFVTTPNRWYPVEFHTMLPLAHYLPTPLYRRVYRRLGFDFFSQEENLNLLDRDAFAAMIPSGLNAGVKEHRFLGMTANLLLVVRG